jgi:cellulose synthase/poly-beta-1,6-N-acetylglucosamine synthase-like glycosyltransferase
MGSPPHPGLASGAGVPAAVTAAGESPPFHDAATPAITVIVPAFNEAATIAATLLSLRQQTIIPAAIIVVDDCSDDGTGEVAAQLGATVVRPPANTGSKAGAQTFGLRFVETGLVVAIDADTTLAPDALAQLLSAFERPDVAAACGFVLPRHVDSVWERGRYIEYLFAFTFYKQVQDYYGRPLIASGCFAMYRTAILRASGGWSTRTLAEDMDLTWTFYQAGHGVRFVPEAVCYPIEPHEYRHLHAQLRRWSHGFVQNVRLHWRGLLDVPFLRSAVAVTLWDASVASVAFLIVLPLMALLLANPWPLLGYLIDAPAVAIPVLAAAWKRGETGRALASLPAFFVLRTVNAVFFVRALWFELVMGRPLLVYEKGH